MFGFLNAPCSSCHSKEHSVYRAHFCGLCNRLRQDYGLPMRFLVNRDATFLSLLGSALVESSFKPVKTTCCNPLGKPRLVVQDGEAVSYAAAVTVCGLGAKLDDEVADRGHHPSGVALRGIRSGLGKKISKAEGVLSQRGFPLDVVHLRLNDQLRVEAEARASGDPDLEELSRPTAFTFGKILRHSSKHAGDMLEHIGEHLGQLIYVFDALTDRKRDERTGQFNPFLLQPQLIDSVPMMLDQNRTALASSMRQLPLFGHKEVIHAILGPGIQQTCASALDGNGSVRPDLQKPKRKKQSRQQHDCCPGWDCCDCVLCCDSGCSSDCCDLCSGDCCDCGTCCCDCN